jgi:hypothetical protein
MKADPISFFLRSSAIRELSRFRKPTINEPTVSVCSGPLIVIELAGIIAFIVWGLRYFGIGPPTQDQLNPEEAKTFYGSQLRQREFGRRIS